MIPGLDAEQVACFACDGQRLVLCNCNFAEVNGDSGCDECEGTGYVDCGECEGTGVNYVPPEKT